METKRVATALRVWPKCPILGSVSPKTEEDILYPEKCIKCRYLFESECMRPEENCASPEYYKSLDWGPCHIRSDGALTTIQILFRFQVIDMVVPSKCSNCHHLQYSAMGGLACNRLHRTPMLKLGVPLDWSEVPDKVIKALYHDEIKKGISEDDKLNLPFGKKTVAPPKIQPSNMPFSL